MTKQQLLTITAQYYHSQLPDHIREKLKECRGLARDTIDDFLLGFACGGLHRFLTIDKGIPEEECIEAGVLRRQESGEVKDYYHNRILIPTLKQGEVVHLTGRSLGSDEPKYLHIPGRIEHLYNEDALESSEVLVVEGPFDCMAAEQIGLNAVATLGTSLKAEFEERFSRCETIYVCMDGDEPGRQAAIQIAERFMDRARIVDLPEGIDLDEFLQKHTREEFDTLIDSSQDVISRLVDRIPPDHDKEQLTSFLKPIIEKMSRLDRPDCELHLNRIKSRFDLRNIDIAAYRSVLIGLKKGEERENRAAQKRQDKAEYSASFDGLVDLVDHDGQVSFLVKEENALVINVSAELPEKCVVPPPVESIPWVLPRAAEIITHYEKYESRDPLEIDSRLFDDLVEYHTSISELPADSHYDLLALWDLHTYLHDRSQYSPIVCLFAVPERGKSRTGKGMSYVAYRGIHVESLREAYLLRVGHDLHASVFFDVRDLWQKAERANSDDIILHRFEQGARVPRVLYPDRGPFQDTVYYTVYGPTIIGTNEGLHHILDTRCITINMPEAKTTFAGDVTPELALTLKERLVAFRAKHMNEALPHADRPASGRLGDILRPFLQILKLVRPDREESFRQLVKDIEVARLVEKRESPEAQILTAIIKLEGRVQGGKLKSSHILDKVNEDKSERQKISDRTLGRRLSAMGFDKVVWSDGSKAIEYDEGKIRMMATSYGLTHLLDTPETPDTLDDFPRL